MYETPVEKMATYRICDPKRRPAVQMSQRGIHIQKYGQDCISIFTQYCQHGSSLSRYWDKIHFVSNNDNDNKMELEIFQMS